MKRRPRDIDREVSEHPILGVQEREPIIQHAGEGLLLDPGGEAGQRFGQVRARGREILLAALAEMDAVADLQEYRPGTSEVPQTMPAERAPFGSSMAGGTWPAPVIAINLPDLGKADRWSARHEPFPLSPSTPPRCWAVPLSVAGSISKPASTMG
jgi:hypothetical protein